MSSYYPLYTGHQIKKGEIDLEVIFPALDRPEDVKKLLSLELIGGVLHYVLFDYIADRDPKAAKVFSKVSVFVQGGVVAANLRFAF